MSAEGKCLILRMLPFASSCSQQLGGGGFAHPLSWDIFGCHVWGEGATGISWLEARDAAKHPLVPRTVSHSKELSAPNVNRADGEKPPISRKEIMACKWTRK